MTRAHMLVILALTTLALTGCTPAQAPVAPSSSAPEPKGLLTLGYENHGQPLPGGYFMLPTRGYTYTASCTGKAESSVTLNLLNRDTGANPAITIPCNTTQTAGSVLPADDPDYKPGTEISADVTAGPEITKFEVLINRR